MPNNQEKLTIALFTHKNADYDAICSTLSLASTLKHLSSKSLTVIPVIEPSPLLTRINNTEKTYTVEEASSMSIDYAIICDVNETDRVYGLPIITSLPVSKRYIIDHHDQNRIEVPALPENKIVEPEATATCSIITEILSKNGIVPDFNIRADLYRGMSSDSANFTRSVTPKTHALVSYLNLTKEERDTITDEITRLSPRQQELYNKVQEETCDEPHLKIFTLLEPASSSDIAIQVKNEKFDKLTSPNEEYPVTIFIIGYGNNYFAKMKKIPTCPINILQMAINCHGGGHETRCSGKFLGTTYLDALTQVMSEYRHAVSELSKDQVKTKNKIK